MKTPPGPFSSFGMSVRSFALNETLIRDRPQDRLMGSMSAMVGPFMDKASPPPRVAFVRSMFGGGDQVENFRRVRAIFPGRIVPRSARPFTFAGGTAVTLPRTFSHAGAIEETSTFLD